MKKLVMMALLMVIPPIIVLAADEKPAGPEGTYKVTALSKGGEKAPDEVTKSFESVTIKGDKFTMKVMGETKVAAVKFDAKAKPASIDITPEEGPEKGKTMLGIWKLEKGVLTIVLAEGKDPVRPKVFDGKVKDEVMIELTMDAKKEEPKKEPISK